MFTIRQMSKLLGITTQMIRNYERYDMLEAERDQRNFRKYDHENIVQLLKIRRMLSMGFSTKQIQQLRKGMSYMEMQKFLKERADQLEHEIQFLIQKRNSITPIYNFMKAVQQKNGTCELITVPEGYCFPLIREDQILISDDKLDTLEKWNQYAFAIVEVRRFKLEALMAGLDQDEITMEYFVRAVDAQMAGLDISQAYWRPEHLCMRAYSIEKGGLKIPVAQRFSFVADYIRENGLCVIGDPMVFLPLWVREDGENTYMVMEVCVDKVD